MFLYKSSIVWKRFCYVLDLENVVLFYRIIGDYGRKSATICPDVLLQSTNGYQSTISK